MIWEKFYVVHFEQTLFLSIFCYITLFKTDYNNVMASTKENSIPNINLSNLSLVTVTLCKYTLEEVKCLSNKIISTIGKFIKCVM
jgi:hypothetical protein